MMKKQRYVIEASHADLESFEIALQEACIVCKELNIEAITLIVPAKRYFPTTAIGQELGKPLIKSLCSNEGYQLQENISLKLESIGNLSSTKQYGLMIGIYLGPDNQDSLAAAKQAQAVMLLPDNEELGKAWLSKWNAKVLRQKDWQAESLQIDQAVETALEELDDNITISHDLTHSSDQQKVEAVFVNVKKHGHFVDPESIFKWALQNGWELEHAKRLAAIAKKCYKK